MLDWKAVSKGVNWCEMGSEVGEVAGGACLEFGLTLRALGSLEAKGPAARRVGGQFLPR